MSGGPGMICVPATLKICAVPTVIWMPVVTGIQITVGTAQIFSVAGTQIIPGPPDITNSSASGTDLADTDDFVYSEPTAAVSPFDRCLQDERSGDTLQFSSFTGRY